MVKSESLFTLQFQSAPELTINFAGDLCVDGFYQTNDMVTLNANNLFPLGRIDDHVKISGRLISGNELKEKLSSYSLHHGIYEKVELTFMPDERIGNKVTLLALPGTESFFPELIKLFSPVPLEIKTVSSFEKTELGKLKIRTSLKDPGDIS